MPPTLILYLSVKAMNDTIGPGGLVPSSLLFGEMPTVRMINEPLIQKSTLSERAQAAMEARKEMAMHMEKMRIKREMTYNVLAAADRIFNPGDKVLVWREKKVEHRIDELLGTFEVVVHDQATKQAHVKDLADSSIS